MLSGLKIRSDPNLIVGFDTGDDAAVYRLDDRTALVFTVDFFAPIVDDPYEYGAIAVANALSDVYAVGGKPLWGLNIAAFPRSLPHGVPADILRGGADKAAEAGVLIVGGHTVEDAEPKYGLAVVGLIEPGKEIRNSNSQPGDALILTKPIGTGVISTAGKSGGASEKVLATAVHSMLRLNDDAAEAMKETGVNAATDISGFGLIGHLLEMMCASGVSAEISRSKVPILPGVIELLAQGMVSGGTRRNLEASEGEAHWSADISDLDKLLLCDAQTSGGLLISVSAGNVDSLMSALSSRNVPGTIIGSVSESSDGASIEVTV